ncbi:MAG TPA: FAD-binding protein [Amycolatopsis sp.]|nr:FAD-binding protein [Amycolatopsis sp.]
MTDSADLLVIGFGAAGAAAAITAADSDASVIVLEKQEEEWHSPSTSMSGGVIMGVNDVDAATGYLDRCSGGLIPVEVSRAWATYAAGVFGWLSDSGVEVSYRREGRGEHPTIAGFEAVEYWRHATLRDGSPVTAAYEGSSAQLALGTAGKAGEKLVRTGLDLWRALTKAVAARPQVEVRWQSPGQRLLTDDAGRVVGVEVAGGQRFYGRRGVVLTTGGFEFDEEMKANFLRVRSAHFYGNAGNSGDGVRMAQQVGADLWHMNTFVGRGVGHFALEGTEYTFIMHLRPGGYVIVDGDGRRFANEHNQAELRHDFWQEFLHYDSERRDYPRIPSYWLFDSRRMKAGALTSTTHGLVGIGRYDWSHTNEKELAQGWLTTGDTPAEAARAAGVRDPARVADEVADYNRACESGVDRLGRPAESLVPLDAPPFYCVPLFPGGSNTSGGPRRDEHARVLDPQRTPIPGLYAAGELGQAIGELYPADGCNLSEALCFGRIAAETALRARP